MKGEDIDQRHAAAYHVAGQAAMAFYLGGWVNDEGVEIDERRYCGSYFPFGHDAQAKERFLLLCDLARAHCVERPRVRCCQAHGTRQAERSRSSGSYRRRRGETPPVGRFSAGKPVRFRAVLTNPEPVDLGHAIHH